MKRIGLTFIIIHLLLLNVDGQQIGIGQVTPTGMVRITYDNYLSEKASSSTLIGQSNHFGLLFEDSSTGQPLNEGNGLIISVVFKRIEAKATTFYRDYRKNEMFYLRYEEDPVYLTASPVNLTCYTKPFEECKIPIEADLNIRTGKSNMGGLVETYLYISHVDAEVEIKCKDYESRKIAFSDNPIFIDGTVVTLIPQIQNVKLSGGIDVNNKNGNSNSSPQNALNVYSSKQIAEMLGVDESDIILLLKTQKLKGKMIGDKWVVRKEDFDAYMKQ